MSWTKAQLVADIQGLKALANSHTAGDGVLHLEAIIPGTAPNSYTVTLHGGSVSAGNETVTWGDNSVVIEIEDGVSTVAQVLAAIGGVTGTPWAVLSEVTAGTLLSVSSTPMSSLPAYSAGTVGQFIGVGTPENPGSEGEVNGVTKYIVNVNEVGLSQTSKKPTGYRRTLTFYVYHEGRSDEFAWYERDEPVNSSNTDITADSTYLSYTRIFDSTELRKRTLGALIKLADYFLFAETPSQSYHWAQAFIKDPAFYMDAFMCELASNNDIRASGNATSDATLYYCTEILMPKIATAYGIT